VIFDRLIDLLPRAAEERRDRGLLFGRLGAPDAALADLACYLELAPNAPDATQVRQWMAQIEQAARAGSAMRS
jgi:regulator of sirC expression with transglutaminase-like and TPR domain